jgi:hypothetical protein
MKAKEVIALLQELDGDTELYIFDSEYSDYTEFTCNPEVHLVKNGKGLYGEPTLVPAEKYGKEIIAI